MDHVYCFLVGLVLLAGVGAVALTLGAIVEWTRGWFLLLILLFVIYLMGAKATGILAWSAAPDGSYVSGDSWEATPDGKYVGAE